MTKYEEACFVRELEVGVMQEAIVKAFSGGRKSKWRVLPAQLPYNSMTFSRMDFCKRRTACYADRA
jgi:hypothetical protein